MMHDRGLHVGLLAILTALAVALTATVPASQAWTSSQETYLKDYTPEGSFLETALGFSSPNDPSQPYARTWLIVARDTGLIELDYAEAGSSPFNSTHQTMSLRIQDFGLSTPLSEILFLVPGRNINLGFNQTDNPSRNGLLAFVANHRLVLLNPFTRTVHVNQDIGFQPRWFVEDVVSAGEMYEFPETMGEGSPPFYTSYHTYRYIVAANETHLGVYRVNYRSNFDNPVIPATDGVATLASMDVNVSSEPLAYYLQLRPERSGIFVPLSNNSVVVLSIDGANRTYLDPFLAGEQAYVSAPLGFSRAPERSMVYLPLKSASKTGVMYLMPIDIPSGDIIETHILEIDDQTATVSSMPDPGNGATLYFLVAYSAGGADVMRGMADGTLNPTLNLHLNLSVKSFFYSPTTSQVFALDSAGTIRASWTISGTGYEPGWVNFSGDSDAQRTSLSYMGGWEGAKYSAMLAPHAVYGLAFSRPTGAAIVFDLLTMPESEDGGGGSIGVDTMLIVGLVVAVVAVMVLAVIAVLVRKPKEPPQQAWPPR